jgi:hypothetical protein
MDDCRTLGRRLRTWRCRLRRKRSCIRLKIDLTPANRRHPVRHADKQEYQCHRLRDANCDLQAAPRPSRSSRRRPSRGRSFPFHLSLQQIILALALHNISAHNMSPLCYASLTSFALNPFPLFDEDKYARVPFFCFAPIMG